MPNGLGDLGYNKPHVHQAKIYAWKPLAIRDAVEKYKRVIWLDAGCTVKAPLRSTLFPILEKNGHFVIQGQDTDMVRWSHDGTWLYFGLNKTVFQGKPSFAGGVNGWIYGSEEYHKILVPWSKCALDERCISPTGSSLANHRFDQSVLSIIIYTTNVTIFPHTEEHFWRAPTVIKPPCFQVQASAVYTSRGEESCYERYATSCENAARLTSQEVPWLAEPLYACETM